MREFNQGDADGLVFTFKALCFVAFMAVTTFVLPFIFVDDFSLRETVIAFMMRMWMFLIIVFIIYSVVSPPNPR